MEIRLDTRLPASLPPDCRTALFVVGSCFHRRLAIRSVDLGANGEWAPSSASGMPRLDLFRALHPEIPLDHGEARTDPDSDEDPNLLSYRSGFWGTVPVETRAGEAVEVFLRARLEDGTFREAPLGTIAIAEEASPATVPTGARVAVAMATFDPDPELFRAQVESIRAQSMTDWVCVISDDRSPPGAVESMRAAIGDDPRFAISISPRRIGFYRNFERALRMVPASAPFVALADQDDRWYPNKLAALMEAIGDAALAYSDQRVVDPEGAVLSETYWSNRRNNHSDFTSLLVTNTVTGAASLFRRELLDLALPFPETPGVQYHDHWLGLVALATGRIAYVPRPLYDYVQHGGAVLGHAEGNRPGGLGHRLALVAARLRRREWRRLFVGWRTAYFSAYCRIKVLAEVLIVRGGPSLPRRSQRALRRFIRAERSPIAFARLLFHPIGHPETMGAERLVARGIVWRHLVTTLTAGRRLPTARFAYEATVPPGPRDARISELDNEPARALAERIEPLELSVSAEAPERVNLLVPTIDLRHLFGGYIAKFNLARKLAELGLGVRILTVDPTPPLPRDWRQRVEAYAGLEGLFDRVEVAFARDRDAPVEVSNDDTFIATTWWTAHIAHAALRSGSRTQFLYLIQEYEPFTFPMGSWAALAAASYELPHLALFSSELLRQFFAARGYGVFSHGRDDGERDSVSFENAITPVAPPPIEAMASRDRRRLLFYARPEKHGARNMFELGLLAMSQAAAGGGLGGTWDLEGIGAVEGHDRIHLGGGRSLDVIPRRDQADYAALLTSYDVGVALMATPHPSLVPLEMAAAGMPTVTNTFETKTREALEAISANLIAVPPSLEGVSAGIEEAARRAGDYRARAEGASVRWSRSWEESFDPQLMRRIVELLEAC